MYIRQVDITKAIQNINAKFTHSWNITWDIFFYASDKGVLQTTEKCHFKNFPNNRELR